MKAAVFYQTNLSDAGQLHIAIGQEFDLNDIVAAHVRVESGGFGNSELRISHTGANSNINM